jgi:hypothetical protein
MLSAKKYLPLEKTRSAYIRLPSRIIIKDAQVFLGSNFGRYLEWGFADYTLRLFQRDSEKVVSLC